MKRYIKLLLCLSFLVLLAHHCFAQLNVELLHQLVAESKSEHERQSGARDKQAENTATEEVNKTAMSSFKSKYRDIQSRFKIIFGALDAVMIGEQAIPIINDILAKQEIIFSLAINDPVLAILAVNAEVEMGDNAYRLLNYIFALALSYDDITAMKPSDRNLLFKDILTQLRAIAGSSYALAANLNFYRNHQSSLFKNPFSDFINQDKDLIDEILRKKNLLNH